MIYFFEECGLITRRASIPFSDAAFMAAPGEQWIESDEVVSDATHFVFAGAIVPFPPPPSPAHSWDWGAYEWGVTAEDIQDIKVRRASEINAAREGKQYLPVLYDGVLFDADPQSRTAMIGLDARIRRGDGLAAPWVGWRTYDNSFVWADAPPEQVLLHLINLQRLLEDRWQALLNRSWVLKDALAQLGSVDDVLAFDAQAGWPT